MASKDLDISYSRYKRNFPYAGKSLINWLKNPVNEDAPKHIFRIIYSVFGPEVHKVAKKAKENPEAKTMFEKREDLGQILADMESLSQMPEGSVGSVFHSFMDGEGIIPGYIIAGLVYADGHFEHLTDWDDDAKFLMVRAGNTHDITHIISGYGTDYCGEVLNLPFSIGGCGISNNKAKALGAVIGSLSYPVLQPKINFTDWVKLNIDSGDRGAEMAKYNSIIEIYFEGLLDKPIEEARKKLKIPPHKHKQFVNKDGWISSKGWTQSKRIKKSVSSKSKKNQNKMELVNAITSLVESGLSVKAVMSSERENIIQAFQALSSGSKQAELEKILTS